MTNVFRALIESTLQTLEAGAFQDFALEFLPLLDPRFKGLALCARMDETVLPPEITVEGETG